MFRRITPVAKNIIIINVVILLLTWIMESFPMPRPLRGISIDELFALRVVFSSEFAPYQFITYMWLHADYIHLFSNMIGVLIFGPMLEQVWGSKRFLIFYLVCGIGAGILYGTVDYIEKIPVKKDMEAYLNNPGPEAFEAFILKHKNPYYFKTHELAKFSDSFFEDPDDEVLIYQAKGIVKFMYETLATKASMVGASGAVFGILFAFAFLFPNTELYLLFLPIPIKAKYLVFFYGAFELFSEVTRAPDDNVAHLAHLGGMLVAFIILKIWGRDSSRLY